MKLELALLALELALPLGDRLRSGAQRLLQRLELVQELGRAPLFPLPFEDPLGHAARAAT